MSGTSQTDPELDRLIAEITIDCYDEDEALVTVIFPIDCLASAG